MKYIILTCLLLTGCISHHQCLICHDGDYREREGRSAMIQMTEPEATLRIVINKQPYAIILSNEDLDALECSIRHYRQRYGYQQESENSDAEMEQR